MVTIFRGSATARLGAVEANEVPLIGQSVSSKLIFFTCCESPPIDRSNFPGSLPQLISEQHGTPGDLKKEQKKDRIEIARDKIPARMVGILESDEKYLGWEDGTVFYESDSDQYLVHVVKENTTGTYRFDKAGEPIVAEPPVTIDETRQ